MGINTQFPVKAAKYNNSAELLAAAKAIRDRLFGLPKKAASKPVSLGDATSAAIELRTSIDAGPAINFDNIEQYVLLVERGDSKNDKDITAARIFAYELCVGRGVSFLDMVACHSVASTQDLYQAMRDVRPHFPSLSTASLGRVFFRNRRIANIAISRGGDKAGRKINLVNPSEIDKDKVKRLVLDGMSIASITATMNCSIRQVQKVRTSMKLEDEGKYLKSQIDRAKIHELLLSGCGIVRVAIDVGVSERTVKRERNVLQARGKMVKDGARWAVVKGAHQ